MARCRHRMLSLGPRRREEQRLPVDRVGNRPTRIASGRGAVENCLSPRSKDRLAPLPSSTSATAQAISPSAPGRSGSRTRLTTPSRRSTRRRTSPRPSDPGWRWAHVRGRGPRVGLGRDAARAFVARSVGDRTRGLLDGKGRALRRRLPGGGRRLRRLRSACSCRCRRRCGRVKTNMGVVCLDPPPDIMITIG